MGLYRMSGSSADRAPMPNPKRFEILRQQEIPATGGKPVRVLEVQYPDCTTYEGRKILLYSGPWALMLGKLTPAELDPHFREVGLHPTARFEPTDQGWQYALALGRMIAGFPS